MQYLNRRSARLAGFSLACLGLSVLRVASATPISYNLQVAGGAWDCGHLRPVNQACPAALSGTLTVDSAKGDVAAQLVDFTLQVGDYLTFTRSELSSSGIASSWFNFDGGGTLTGFYLRNFFGPRGVQGPLGESLNLYYMNLGGGTGSNEFRLGNRTDPIVLNQCASCVSFARAVPEPGALSLWVIALGGLWVTWRAAGTQPRVRASR